MKEFIFQLFTKLQSLRLVRIDWINVTEKIKFVSRRVENTARKG